jgi:curved DNA-binding protein CbpA
VPRLAWAVMQRADHYQTLGVAAGASHLELRAAYRRLMREHHPDLRPGDPAAEAMTRRLTEAWAVLGRPGRRAAYDRTLAATRVTAPPPLRPQPPATPAYSSEGRDYRRAFHLASLKAATVVFVFGLAVLLTLSR